MHRLCWAATHVSTELSPPCVRCRKGPTEHGASRPAGLGLDPVGQLGDLVEDRPTLGHQSADLPVGVHDRGVVAAAEAGSDQWQTQVVELATQKHRSFASVLMFA